MAATKRNAGLTSAVPRATLNDEELVRNFNIVPKDVFFSRKKSKKKDFVFETMVFESLVFSFAEQFRKTQKQCFLSINGVDQALLT